MTDPRHRNLRKRGPSPCHPALGLGLLAALWLLVLSALPAGAQRFLPDERPGDQPPELPPFEEPEPSLQPLPILPLYPIPSEPSRGALAAGPRVEIRQIRITGNSVIASDVLAEITRPYEGRNLSFGDLEELRDRLTVAYVERGYATSGATLPDQS